MVEAVKRPAPAEANTTSASKKQLVSAGTTWAWLWKNGTFSDIKIVLVTDSSSGRVSNPEAAVVKTEGNGHQPQQEQQQHATGPQGTGDKAPETARTDGVSARSTAVLLEVPAHKVVVASASHYFCDRLVTWDQEQTQRRAAAQERQSDDVSGGADTSQVLATPTGDSVPVACVLEEVILPDQLSAAEAVIQFMYTQELPKHLDTLLLITVTRLAERWDVPACTQACLQALASLTPSQLPANVIGSLLSDDLPKSIVDQPLYHPLIDACRQRIIQLFGTVQTVVTNDSLRQSFCELPFTALKLWARLDELKIDSENSVAVLISHWWMYHYASYVRPPSAPHGTNRATTTATATTGAVPVVSPAGLSDSLAQLPAHLIEQRRVLCGLVRLNNLSASFFTGVLQTLPWWGPPQDAFNMLCMARALHSSKGTLLQQPIRERIPTAWLAKPRLKDPAPDTIHQWVVSADDLQSLHKDAGAGRMLRESPGLYWSGYMWHLCLSLNSQRDALWVGVRARSAVPAAYNVPVLMEAKFTIAVKEASTKEYTKKETLNFGDGAALQPANCNGTPRLLAVPAATAARPASLPPASLMIDSKLYLQLTLEGMG